MAENYLNILADTIRNNWDAPALTDFYLTEDGTAQDTSRGNHYTYGEMYAEICSVAELLTSLGLQKGDHIAICGANSAHWVIAYLAIAKMQGVSVTVMHTLMPDEKARLVNFSDAKALFADEDLWGEISPRLGRGDGDRLSSVISLADWSILRGEKNTNYKLQITNGEIGFSPVEPDSLATICFTSGTTGKAKGVMLPYRSFSLNISAKREVLAHFKQYGTHFCSFLPFGHIFGLMEDCMRVLTGGMHCYVLQISNSPKDLFTCYKLIQPMYITMVPQLLELFINYVDKYPITQQKSFIKTTLGRNLKELIIGGASLSRNQLQHIIELGIPLATCYGITECGPTIAFALSYEYKLGTSGIVIDELNCRISPAGEILVKGENVMLGYYKDPEATARKIDSDGWLHTGDKGHLDEDGYLYVEGRLEQDIIVLPNGENIRPDNIEALINALPEVSESIVLARDGHLVAIVVPATPSSVSSASSETRASSPSSSLRRKILRTVNPSLPLFSQLYDVEITDQPLARTEKQTLKRYLYS
jgi:long-chain acyl-CoA synthetase